jgi:hypothetical protein
VLITSYKNRYLHDNGNGEVKLSGDAAMWKKWRIMDAGNGLVTIHNLDDKYNLQDHYGSLRLSHNALGWEYWKLIDAGNGLVNLKSHRDQNLQDADGELKLALHAGRTEQWGIRDPSYSLVKWTTFTNAKNFLECFDGKTVLITSYKRHENLQDDSSGTPGLSSNSGFWQHWTISSVGHGKVTLQSELNRNLQDNYGKVKLSSNSLSWEYWTMTDAGYGLVEFKSHTGLHLANKDGQLELSDKVANARWIIRDTSGTLVSCSAASQPRSTCADYQCPCTMDVETKLSDDRLSYNRL